MDIPGTPFSVIALIALLLPGIVFAAAQTSFEGFRSQDTNIVGRILKALMVSVVLDAIYLALLGSWLQPYARLGKSVLTEHPVLVGVLTLVLGVLVPVMIGYVLYSGAPWTRQSSAFLSRGFTRIRTAIRPDTQYSKYPTAWDFAAPAKGDTWIRVLTADGLWVGGWFSRDGFIGTYPEPRDVFIPIQYQMGTRGEFGEPVPQSAGVWLSLENARVVEWVNGDPLGGQ